MHGMGKDWPNRAARIDRVVDGAYAATVQINGPAGTTLVDARSSDALNLAARLNAPIAAASGVLAEAAERREADTADAALLRRARAAPAHVHRRETAVDVPVLKGLPGPIRDNRTMEMR